MDASVTSDYLRISLFSIAIVFWLYWLWTRRNLYKFSLKFPRVWGLPLLGVAGYINDKTDLLPAIGNLMNQCKFTLCTWIGTHSIWITTEPELIEKVLTSSDLLNKANCVKPISKIFGPSIIASPVETWQHHRKLLNPAFHRKVLLNFFSIFEKAKNELIEKFSKMDDSQQHPIFELMLTASFGVSVKTTIGTEIETNDKFFDFLHDCRYLLGKLINHFVLEVFGVCWLYTFHAKYQKTKENLNQFIRKVLDTKLYNVLVEGGGQNDVAEKLVEGNSESTKKMPNVFIDQAIQIYQEKKFDYDDIIHETTSMVIASFETTATTTFSAIMMLAMHPHVQERLFEEICSVFPDKDFQMDYAQMQQLPYFDMFLNEVLRLAPALPIIARQVVKDTQIDKDLTLPKEMQIIISIFHLHRRPEIWGSNADKFDPDRFLPKNMVGKHSYSFVPFSKGARNCIGSRYALYFMKIVLVGLVRNFKFSTDFKYEDLEFVANVSLLYKQYPNIKIQRR